MPILNEGNYTAEFLSSVANKTLSFEEGTLATAQNLKAGAVIARITASGLLTALNPAGADGSQTPVGLLFDNEVTTTATKRVTFVARQAEAKNARVSFPVGITGPQRTAAVATLAGLGIVLR